MRMPPTSVSHLSSLDRLPQRRSASGAYWFAFESHHAGGGNPGLVDAALSGENPDAALLQIVDVGAAAAGR